MARERIGIMGGTFDPVHYGHIGMAKAAVNAGKLDRVLMLPTGNPPHKKGITPAEQRWQMLCAAVAKEPMLEPCRMEIDRGGVIYTVDTLSELHRIYPEAELFYIIGEDTLMELKNWRCYETVLKLCTFLVCPRARTADDAALLAEQARLERIGGRFIKVNMQPINISSTAVRNAIASGEETPLLPLVCREYAALAGLYGAPCRLGNNTHWLDKLFAALKRTRFAHTLAVAHEARRLALVHGLDADRAELAGVLHDCAKCMPVDAMRAICLQHNLGADADMLESGELMHQYVGAHIAREEYGMTDDAVLQAIACHTTGAPGMTPLDMVINLADKIEYTRESYPQLETVRSLAEESLPRALLASLTGTVAYVRSKGGAVHPRTMETMEWLKTLPGVVAGE